ncbi:MAG TPA: hypothetical protein VIS03_04650 [Kiloniellaceae bacterium]
MNRIVPVGTTGQATSLRVQSLRALARKVVKQIEAPRSPDPIMRRPCADCEEKRVTYGDDEPDDDADQEQLDLDNPNQRGLLVAEKFLLPSPDQDVDARVGALAKAPMKERSDVRSG